MTFLICSPNLTNGNFGSFGKKTIIIDTVLRNTWN